jgi:hypothetical protein
MTFVWTLMILVIVLFGPVLVVAVLERVTRR